MEEPTLLEVIEFLKERGSQARFCSVCAGTGEDMEKFHRWSLLYEKAASLLTDLEEPTSA